MKPSKVSFSISEYAAWAPGIETPEAWMAWARSPLPICADSEPDIKHVPPMLRRRASFLGRMALESAYRCVGENKNVPAIFCSRHGEFSRSLEMLSDLAKGNQLSPTSFGLSVHNAIGALFSIARTEKVNNIALAGGLVSVETAVVEACALLADGEPRVLLVVYDCPLPHSFTCFQDVDEQPYSWAWLMEPAGENLVSLEWSDAAESSPAETDSLPPGLQIFRSYLLGEDKLNRVYGRQRWSWNWNG